MDNSLVIALPEVIEEPVRQPSHLNLATVFAGGIFLFMLLTALHVASEIVIPVVLAFVLKLVFQPVLRWLGKWRIPRALAAGMIIIMLITLMAGLGTALSGPAATWGNKLPDSFPQLQHRLNFLRKPVEKTQKILVQAEDITKGSGPKAMPVTMQGTRLSDKVISATQAAVAGLFTTMLILFFLLAAGDTFLRRLVEVLPKFKDKRQAVDISQQIEQDISIYLLTITAMNAAVGCATAIMMWTLGMEDPLLWGAFAFLLNYVPIIGPMIGAATFTLVGSMVLDDGLAGFLPALLYLGIHFMESSVMTPMLLARRFTLNPVLVILSLIFWYWMWGIPGAILAMPMLAITKIICDRIETLSSFGHFLEG